LDKKFISVRKENVPVRRCRRENRKQTLAVAVGLGKVPMLPEKLLEELLPGIRRALFKGR
jgi:hypothetical protein